MKKRFLRFLTLLFALCTALCVFTACNGEENHVHDYKILKYDEEGHWFECECKAKVGITKHTFEDNVCICGYETMAHNSHVYVTLKYDNKNHWVECQCGEKLNATGHVLVDNVCVCGYVKTDSHVHDYKTVKYDSENHWFECECGDKLSELAHNLIANECACGYSLDEEHQHDYVNIKYDNTNHWFECECGKKTSIVAHNLVGGACACGYIDSGIHVHDYKEIKYDKVNHWFECDCNEVTGLTAHTFIEGICACGQNADGVHVHDYKNVEFDVDNHWFECDCGDKISIAEHNLLNYACACGYRDEDVHFHDYNIVEYDSENHWFKCECGEETNAVAHDFVNNVCACGYSNTVVHVHEYTSAEYNDTQHKFMCACGDTKAWEAHTIVNNACDCGYTITVVDIKDDEIYVEVGSSENVDYNIRNYKNQSIVWSTSNSAVCTISSGKIQGVKEGTVTITLTVGNASATCIVHVFNYQNETASTYTTPIEVYNYYYEGNVVSNDLAITLADYGMVYNKNVKASFVKGNTTLTATVRASATKLRVFVDLDVLGSSHYGEGYSLVVSSANKKVTIPLSLIVTKYISEKDDLHYLFYFGNMEFNTEYCLYDGYFVQTNDIDMECVPLLNRQPNETYNTEEFMVDPSYTSSSYSGKFQTGTSSDGSATYTYLNVDVGFMGTYDGGGYSIVNLSMYDNQDGYPKFRPSLAGIFGNISRKGVVKNLGITATDTWGWYEYTSVFVLANSINGTLENVYVKITPTLYVLSEESPTSTIKFYVARVISGATLTNVVFELDIPDDMLRDNDDTFTNSRGMANYKNESVCMYEYYGINAYNARYYKAFKAKQTNTFKNCYFFYTSGPTDGVYGTTGFEHYTYEEAVGITFGILTDSTYFELASNGVPTFIGLA